MIPGTLLVYFLAPHHKGFAFLAGVVTGSLLYDALHYAFHCGPDLNFAWFQYMKAQHMRHHFRDGTVEFGVSTDLWDYVMGSKPLD